MSYGKQAARYRETEILTATPGQLVVLLFDHLLVSLSRAKLAMANGDFELQGEHLEKSRNILTELLVTLDRERGGEIAVNLSALYSFLLGELVQVGVRADHARLERVTHMITELRSAFAEASQVPIARSA
jgi:flagellar secretion chaperone FliS